MRGPIVWLIDVVASIAIFVVLAHVVISWLFAFNVLNARNVAVQRVYQTLDAVVEPVVRPLRKRLPKLGGVDLSPLVLLLGLGFIRQVALSFAG